jgi:hypothetical protein
LGITQRPVPREVTSRMRTGASIAFPSVRYGKAAIWRMAALRILRAMPEIGFCDNFATARNCALFRVLASETPAWGESSGRRRQAAREWFV